MIFKLFNKVLKAPESLVNSFKLAISNSTNESAKESAKIGTAVLLCVSVLIDLGLGLRDGFNWSDLEQLLSIEFIGAIPLAIMYFKNRKNRKDRNE